MTNDTQFLVRAADYFRTEIALDNQTQMFTYVWNGDMATILTKCHYRLLEPLSEGGFSRTTKISPDTKYLTDSYGPWLQLPYHYP